MLGREVDESHDLYFALKLNKVQVNHSQPLLVDCIVVKKPDFLEVHGIVNFENLPMNTSYHKHIFYELSFNKKIYKNQMPDHQFSSRVQVINYTIPLQENRKEVEFQIIDRVYDISYTVNTPILIPPPTKKRLAVCAYVSDYNTVNEIRSWLAYYKMIGVDNVILYTALELETIHESLLDQIKSGFLRWYKYYWPLFNYFGHIQRSVQMSQINSCFYRHRHEYEYMILLDIDEYMLSYRNPFDIYKSIVNHFTENEDVLIVQASMFGRPGRHDREALLSNGKIFDYYTCWLDNKETKREKFVLHSRASGFFGNHNCCNCRKRVIDMTDLRVFHLRASLKEYRHIRRYCNANHTYLTEKFQKVLKNI